MVDRPIIMSAPMVKALVAWRKTQTRRRAWRDTGKPSPWQKIAAGDRLWVREAWAAAARGIVATGVIFRADREAGARPGPAAGAWRPSIHMPRWASRLTLEVTATRIERLQEISEEDATAEGALSAYGEPFHLDSSLTNRRRFELLWESLRGDGSWKENPEVVAFSFTVHQRNIDAEAA